jgi:hypothetical protein
MSKNKQNFIQGCSREQALVAWAAWGSVQSPDLLLRLTAGQHVILTRLAAAAPAAEGGAQLLEKSQLGSTSSSHAWPAAAPAAEGGAQLHDKLCPVSCRRGRELAA